MSPTFSLRNNALGYHHARLEDKELGGIVEKRTSAR